MKEPWTFTEETYTKGKTSYTVYYAAPKPYKYGFITSPTDTQGLNVNICGCLHSKFW